MHRIELFTTEFVWLFTISGTFKDTTEWIIVVRLLNSLSILIHDNADIAQMVFQVIMIFMVFTIQRDIALFC